MFKIKYDFAHKGHLPFNACLHNFQIKISNFEAGKLIIRL